MSQKSKLEIANQNFTSYYGFNNDNNSVTIDHDEGEGGGEGGGGDEAQSVDSPVEYSQHYSISTTRQCSATSTRQGDSHQTRVGVGVAVVVGNGSSNRHIINSEAPTLPDSKIEEDGGF